MQINPTPSVVLYLTLPPHWEYSYTGWSRRIAKAKVQCNRNTSTTTTLLILHRWQKTVCMFSFPKKMKLLGSGDDASIMERKLSETCFSEQLGMTDGRKLSLFLQRLVLTQLFDKDCSFLENSNCHCSSWYKRVYSILLQNTFLLKYCALALSKLPHCVIISTN